MTVLAAATPFDRTAQCRGAAGLDGLHQAMLMQGQRVTLPVGGTVLSKDVGQLQSRPRHQRLARAPRVAGGGAGFSNRSSGLAVAPMAAGETAI